MEKNIIAIAKKVVPPLAIWCMGTGFGLLILKWYGV